jgi:hypothetical protein
MALISLRRSKVNIDIECRMAMTAQLSTAGHASKIKFIPVPQMVERCKSGELEPQTDRKPSSGSVD